MQTLSLLFGIVFLRLPWNLAPILGYFLGIWPCCIFLCESLQWLLISANMTKFGQKWSFFVKAINFASITQFGHRKCTVKNFPLHDPQNRVLLWYFPKWLKENHLDFCGLCENYYCFYHGTIIQTRITCNKVPL